MLAELPTYDRPLKILRELGSDVELLACDDEGLDPDALEQALRAGPAPAFLYLIPTFQNPSGRTLSLERRRRIVELAQEHELLVLEDDPYGLVRYEGEALPSLFELSRWEPRLQLVVLEDDRAGPARRLVRVPGATSRSRSRLQPPRPTSRRCCSARRR